MSVTWGRWKSSSPGHRDWRVSETTIYVYIGDIFSKQHCSFRTGAAVIRDRRLPFLPRACSFLAILPSSSIDHSPLTPWREFRVPAKARRRGRSWREERQNDASNARFASQTVTNGSCRSIIPTFHRQIYLAMLRSAGWICSHIGRVSHISNTLRWLCFFLFFYLYDLQHDLRLSSLFIIDVQIYAREYESLK